MGAIQFVRHGQASFGAAEYDVLSELGHEQARSLGRAWRGITPWSTEHMSGTLQRQVATSTAVVSEVDGAASNRTDPRWNEYSLLATLSYWGAGSSDEREFQARFNETLRAWVAGTHEAPESYQEFSSRIHEAFDELVGSTGKGKVVRVFTSAGPIALLVSALLTGGSQLFEYLNGVMLNASVTTVTIGRAGPRVLAFNQHGHLAPDLLTYR